MPHNSTDPQPSCSENYQLQMRELLRNHERHFKQLGERSDHNNCSRCDVFVLQMDNFIKEVVSAKQKTIEELTAKLVAEQDMTSKLSDDLLEREVRLHAYESYRIFKQDTFRAVDGGAPVMEIDAVKAFEVIDRLRTALEKIRETKYATVIRHIAREALQ